MLAHSTGRLSATTLDAAMRAASVYPVAILRSFKELLPELFLVDLRPGDQHPPKPLTTRRLFSFVHGTIHTVSCLWCLLSNVSSRRVVTCSHAVGESIRREQPHTFPMAFRGMLSMMRSFEGICRGQPSITHRTGLGRCYEEPCTLPPVQPPSTNFQGQLGNASAQVTLHLHPSPYYTPVTIQYRH